MHDPIPVKSEAISAMAYSGGALTVWWKNSNRATTYLGISPDMWERLQASDSKGRFIAKNIKGKYKEAQ